jgi:sugar phosphate isomerase/epimerase
MAFRFATCNEVFQNQPIADVCSQVREVGYQGLEMAPFTLGPDPAALSQEDRLTLRHIFENAQLEFVGLHWLLAAPEGLHATAPDKNIRQRTWQYVDRFVDLCADLAHSPDGRNGVVVFGSPKQRASRDGMTPRQATEIFVDGLAKAAPHAEERGVTLLVEALSPDQCDVVTSLSEAVAIVQQIGSPAVQTMFDVHNAIAETEPHIALIRDFFPFIRHVHVNELDGREPGMGNYDFAALLKCLTELNYQGWVSLEAFDFTRDPKEIVSRSFNHLRNCLPLMASV